MNWVRLAVEQLLEGDDDGNLDEDDIDTVRHLLGYLDDADADRLLGQLLANLDNPLEAVDDGELDNTVEQLLASLGGERDAAVPEPDDGNLDALLAALADSASTDVLLAALAGGSLDPAPGRPPHTGGG